MDRLYRQIIAALEGHLDDELFEACVCDLLRDAFQGLVSIRGGTDAGMDGAIADGEGEAFPLICTTSQDVISNLTDSLDSYLQAGLLRRKAVLATSQALTQRRRRNLEQRAREKGFTLVQIVDQEGMARRLRWSPYWCKEIGIPWEPSALSAVPKTRRPLLEIELVGRETDLEWLRSTSGDRLLSGQPGSGKTFLLYQLVKEGWALFLVDEDRKAIAGALAQEKPNVVVVDDAHVHLELLASLRHIRDEVGHPFDIVATTWDGEQERVAEAMGELPPAKVHKLELLTREEILEIYRRAGIVAPDGVMGLLVDQAANKPGLAVTLALILLRGGRESLEEVLKGEVLRRTVTSVFRDLLGEEAETVLASFALGGERGMTMAAVAEFLGVGFGEFRTKVVGLAAGGVLSEAGDGGLAVWPRTLRPSLLRSVFFRGCGTDLDFRPLLQRAPSRSSAVDTLVLAAGYGVPIRASELRELVARHGSPRAWRNLAAIDRDSARFTLEQYPGELAGIARQVLSQEPELVIPRLLGGAVVASGPLHSQPDHPLRILSDWIQGAWEEEEAMRRRRLVVEAARRFLASGGERGVGTHALCLALSPRWETLEDDPLGNAVTIKWGLLPTEALEQMSELWPQVCDTLAEIDAVPWRHVKNALWSWIYPRYAAGAEAPDTTTATMHATAANALQALVPLARGRPGLISGLRDLANRIDLELPVEEDPVFELLYPPREAELEAMASGKSDRGEALRSLALEWASLAPHEAARRLAHYENEARTIDRSWPRRVAEFCRHLAPLVPDPEGWRGAFLDQGIAGDLVAPLLEAVALRGRPGWEATVSHCFGEEHLAGYAMSLILRSPQPPENLLERAIEAAARFPQVVETLCLRGEVPVTTLKQLLTKGKREVALAAAVGEWAFDPQGKVRPEVALECREAILRAGTRTVGAARDAGADYLLGRMLASDPHLALEWVLAHLGEHDSPFSLDEDEPMAKAVAALDADQRRLVLQSLPATFLGRDLVALLVDRSSGLYRDLLDLKQLHVLHLVPLAGIPDPSWAELAMVALGGGHSPGEVAAAAFGGSHTYFGYGLDYWSRWEEGFRRLESDPRPEIREVASQGRSSAEEYLRKGRTEERGEKLYGGGR
jgi:hypothetical protein